MCHVEPTAAPVADEPLDPVAVTEAEPVALLCPGSSIRGKTKPTSTQVVYSTVVFPNVHVSLSSAWWGRVTRTVKAVLVGRKVGYVERCADACEANVVYCDSNVVVQHADTACVCKYR